MTGKRSLRQGQSAGLEGMNDPHMHERGMLERIDHPDSAEPDHRLAQHGDLRRLARPFVQRFPNSRHVRDVDPVRVDDRVIREYAAHDRHTRQRLSRAKPTGWLAATRDLAKEPDPK
jgi:hypothetical protein